MKPRAFLVVHRERLAAEGIAAALSRYTALVPVGVATTAREAESFAGRAESVAIDARVPAVDRAVSRLRAAGARIVFTGPEARSMEGEDGGVYVSSAESVALLAAALVPGTWRPAECEGAVDRLTGRERDVLGFAAKGMAGKQIAATLGISPKTVEQHKTRAFRRLGVPNQAAAVALIVRGGR